MELVELPATGEVLPYALSLVLLLVVLLTDRRLAPAPARTREDEWESE